MLAVFGDLPGAEALLLAELEEERIRPGELTPAQLHAALQADFRGHERLQQTMLRRLPHYGADDAFSIDDLDDILPGIMESCSRVYYTMVS